MMPENSPPVSYCALTKLSVLLHQGTRKTSAMVAALPPHNLIVMKKKKTRDIKHKYLEYMVEINIRSREISLGSVENAGQ